MNSKASAILNDLLNELRPNQYALLKAMVPNITDDMLQQIAQADYGMEAEYCLTELKKIRHQQLLPKEILFPLKEVLVLTRWNEAHTVAEHWTRLFACTNLLMMAHQTELMGENQTLANFLESLLSLDEKFYTPALQLIVWRIIQDDANPKFYVEEKPFFIFSLLYLLIQLKKDTTTIKRFYNWFIKEEAASQELAFNNPAFLLGTTVFTQRHRVWKKLAQQLSPQLQYLEDAQLKQQFQENLQSILAFKANKKKF